MQSANNLLLPSATFRFLNMAVQNDALDHQKLHHRAHHFVLRLGVNEHGVECECDDGKIKRKLRLYYAIRGINAGDEMMVPCFHATDGGFSISHRAASPLMAKGDLLSVQHSTHEFEGVGEATILDASTHEVNARISLLREQGKIPEVMAA